VINSWRCSKQVGQLIRFTGDHLKLLCFSCGDDDGDVDVVQWCQGAVVKV